MRSFSLQICVILALVLVTMGSCQGANRGNRGRENDEMIQYSDKAIDSSKFCYQDTLSGFSFILPKRYTVRESKLFAGLDAYASDNDRFFMTEEDAEIGNEFYDQYVGRFHNDSADHFIRVVRERAFFTLSNNFHGIVAYGTIDSIREYKTTSGLRVVLAFARSVNVEDNSKESCEPIYFVDISNIKKDRILIFSFPDSDCDEESIEDILPIVLSVRYKSK
jgi:hypothetical protein